MAATHPVPFELEARQLLLDRDGAWSGEDVPMVVPVGGLALLFLVFARAKSAVAPLPTANATGENVRWEMLAPREAALR